MTVRILMSSRQVLELDKEVERSQGKQGELLEMVDTGKILLNREKMEKSAATKHVRVRYTPRPRI